MNNVKLELLKHNCQMKTRCLQHINFAVFTDSIGIITFPRVRVALKNSVLFNIM